ncbi:maleylacetoacetate isomerase [Vibrio ostreicida]|uniref:Maleylacetoacetate isomerase n=1 Tax=Vibrio ostreicida TaxID=526588 RepID=A0ABT8BVR1_9VIBR|nr:maleylacetoacetate isomerase [Vibrio ostreicida]MDN3610178.1 maleylacetoacetate isomerase [Vibrio ostreicida]NPD07801.1 maleylacetoacetate isomerase [Vibrio ostreicida]
MTDILLYGYWRSSAAYRVRIALNLKRLPFRQESVNLIKNGGEQHSEDFRQLNESQLVPVLIDGGRRLTQSLTIIDYLDEQYPEYLLTPADIDKRFVVKAMAQDIAIDIHPLNNLRVLQYLTDQLATKDEAKSGWYRHWIEVGFDSLEKKLSKTRGDFCVGDDITLVDVCLAPQVYNAERFNVDISRYPNISTVTESLMKQPAFIEAQPENQPDALIA